ncbi:hypothetical protein M405DRAFT_823029 [Rhizopogon salebrosus TDB-379]|nr:hypothetical protein M405DRAFT_823029 [Rhizopogon salebrosus TDB-379]
MLISLTYLIVALALASSILVSAVPLAPITIEPYPSRREPVGALQENTDDIFEVMNPFEVHTASQTAEDGHRHELEKRSKQCCVQ